MKVLPIQTSNPRIHLIEPSIERDAPLSVQWLQGEPGRTTLRLMGVSDSDNKPSSLEQEKERVSSFISNEDQLNWMIAFDDRVVGSIWVDLVEKNLVPPPSIHMMIGAAAARGKGIGKAITPAVLQHLKQNGHDTVYSRHLITNEAVAHLLGNFGFKKMGQPYADEDGKYWQNVLLSFDSSSSD